MRSISLGLLMLMVWPAVLTAGEPTSAVDFATTIEAIFEAVLDHHIEPPTRQEMVLALMRRLHDTDLPAKQAELARTISELPGKDALTDYMRAEIARHAPRLNFDPDHLDRLELNWLSSVVPSGVRIESPKNADVALQLAANRYVGIGVQMTKTDKGYAFPLVMENGTAAKGGLLPGDLLIKINDTAVSGPLDEVIDQLRGPAGSQVRLTVQTEGEEPRDMDLRRQVVMIPTVKLEPLKPSDQSATIKVTNIRASTVHELQTIIERLPKSITEISLKLQFDGHFHYFHLFADALLDEGPLGEMVTRHGHRMIRTFDGNILAGRELTIELTDRDEQQRLLEFLALREDVQIIREHGADIAPIYLQESFPVLNGKAIVSVAARKFQRGPSE